MRILLTTHGMPHDEVGLGFGAHIARYATEPTMVLTVVENAAARPQAEQVLKRARELLLEVPRVETKIRIGHPASEIVREAQEGRYDLIVVGERQNPNLLTRFLSGSDSVRVVEHALCPVIVAKGKVGPIERILLCDSGVEGPLAGFPLAPTWGDRAGNQGSSLLTRFTAQLADFLLGEEEVTVLHVMSQISAGPGIKGKQLRAEAEELIEEHAPEGELLEEDVHVLERPGVRVRPKVRHGLVVDEILAEAEAGDYDLVVIGSHRGEGWQRILLDDIAHKILMQMDRPVLVVR
jgi:nucleotide-binding universal stress UspA family protein